MPTIWRQCHSVSLSSPSLSSERTVVGRTVVAGVETNLAVARPVSASPLSMRFVCVRVMFPSDVVVKFISRKVWMSDSSVRWKLRLRDERMSLSKDWVLAMKRVSST